MQLIKSSGTSLITNGRTLRLNFSGLRILIYCVSKCLGPSFFYINDKIFLNVQAWCQTDTLMPVCVCNWRAVVTYPPLPHTTRGTRTWKSVPPSLGFSDPQDVIFRCVCVYTLLHGMRHFELNRFLKICCLFMAIGLSKRICNEVHLYLGWLEV